MPKWMSLLIGPELIWCVIYGAVALLARANVPPTKTADNLIGQLYLIVPLLAILTFALWFFPGVEKNWLLLRVWVAGLFGAHYALEKGMSAYSDQGPGIGTAYIVGISLAMFALVTGSIFVKIRF